MTDPDYVNGEVGLFVQNLDSPNTRVDFDSITIWSNIMPNVGPTPQAKEICFNNRDDDGDGLVDKADRDCFRSPAPSATETVIPPTNTPDVPTTYP
jgi:hypothetical protein